MWFVFHGSDECQVGIHNTTRGNSLHPHPHNLQVRIWTVRGCNTSGCGTPEIVDLGDSNTFAGIQIDVNQPTTEGVYVYQKDPAGSDPNDWRWVVEFEKEPLYPEGIRLRPNTINPGVSINHGLFYTLHKTTSEFELINLSSGTPHPIGNVAEYIGANIYQSSGDVTLVVRHTFPGQSTIRKLTYEPGTCYQIDITNNCRKNGQKCVFQPDHSTDRKKRNDFYLYYESFDRPRGKPEFALKRKTPHPAQTPTGFCLDEQSTLNKDANDEAPCGGASAGGGGGS
jgi:hypothetical protein